MEKIFARPEGWHFHQKECSLAQDYDYVEITEKEAIKRKLRPCAFCYPRKNIVRVHPIKKNNKGEMK